MMYCAILRSDVITVAQLADDRRISSYAHTPGTSASIILNCSLWHVYSTLRPLLTCYPVLLRPIRTKGNTSYHRTMKLTVSIYKIPSLLSTLSSFDFARSPICLWHFSNFNLLMDSLRFPTISRGDSREPNFSFNYIKYTLNI